MENFLHTLETNHLLHAGVIGILTSLVLKNKTDKNVLVGLGVGGGLYWYMSNYGHSMPCMFNCQDKGPHSHLDHPTVYNNPKDLLSTYSASY